MTYQQDGKNTIYMYLNLVFTITVTGKNHKKQRDYLHRATFVSIVFVLQEQINQKWAD